MDVFISDALEVEEVEIINEINPDRRPYTVGERINHFEIWDDLQFFSKVSPKERYC